MNYLNIILTGLSVFFLLVMAFFIVIKDWRSQLNRYFEFYILSALGILSTMFLVFTFPNLKNITEINRVTQASTVIFFAAVFTMSFVFPTREKKFPFKYAIFIVFPALLVAIVVIFTDLSVFHAEVKNGVLIRTPGKFYVFYAIAAFLYLIMAMINFIRKYFKTNVLIYKLQMKYFFIGVSFALFFASISSIVMPYLYNDLTFYVLGPSIASLFATVALFYSVISLELMDISTVFHKTVMYVVISTIIFIPIYFVLYVYFSNNWINKNFPYYFVIPLLTFVFVMFSLYIQPLINKIFRRKQLVFENMVDNFIRSVSLEKEFEDVISKTVDALHETLFLKTAFILLFNEKTRKYELNYNKAKNKLEVEPLERNSIIIRWFLQNQENLTRTRIYRDENEFSEIKEPFLNFFKQNDLRIVLPIYHENRVLALICLGSKENLSMFSKDQLEKLRYFRNESNEFISTALTYKTAQEEQFIARTVDLSSYLLSKSSSQSLPNNKKIKFGAFIVPKYEDGGNYFDFVRPGQNGIGILISNVSGVGINPAIYSVLMRSSLQASVTEASSSYMVMHNLNRVLYKYNKGKGNFVTAYYVYYDIKSMRLIYSNAGYPPLEIFRVDTNSFETLDSEGIPLGFEESATFGISRTSLILGDIAFLYSKSLINAKNQNGESFGLTRLRSIIRDNRTKKPTEISEIIKEIFVRFMGLSVPESDIIVLIFKVVQ